VVEMLNTGRVGHLDCVDGGQVWVDGPRLTSYLRPPGDPRANREGTRRRLDSEGDRGRNRQGPGGVLAALGVYAAAAANRRRLTELRARTDALTGRASPANSKEMHARQVIRT
jgi:hypothetical protein